MVQARNRQAAPAHLFRSGMDIDKLKTTIRICELQHARRSNKFLAPAWRAVNDRQVDEIG
jgi:hypothetical protein